MIYLNSKKQKLMMSLDWLQWSGYLVGDGINSLPELECPDTYRLEILDGNNTFRWRAILYDYQGHKCITMLWSPKNHLMQFNLVIFQVSNMWFYGFDDIQSIIALASQCFIYQFATMTRIDIAVDFELKRRQKSIIKGLWHHKIVCAGKQENSMFESRGPDGMFPHDFNFGSFKSAIRWKLYNKSKELHVGEDSPDKQYIIDRWLENGMDIYHIWRCEVSITEFNKFQLAAQPLSYNKNKIQYAQRMIMLEDITDVTILAIYSHLYDKRFQLRKKGHTRMSNNERVYLFDLEKHKIYQPNPKSKSESKVDNSVMYSLIKVCESDNAKLNKEMLEHAAYSLYQYVKFNRLDNLFLRLKGKECETWCQEKIDLCGDGVVKLYNSTDDW